MSLGWALVIAGLFTALSRTLPLLAARQTKQLATAQSAWFAALPVAVLSALAVQSALGAHLAWPGGVALVAALAVAWFTRNLLLCLVTAFVIFGALLSAV